MKYQLVLQLPDSALPDYDSMIEIEDILINGLSAEHDVDGHDAGDGQINFFIHTNDPLQLFDEVKGLLSTRPEWPELRAAYRHMSKNEFIFVWPKGLKEFAVT